MCPSRCKSSANFPRVARPEGRVDRSCINGIHKKQKQNQKDQLGFHPLNVGYCSLFNLAAVVLAPDSGEIILNGKGIDRLRANQRSIT